MTTKQKLEEAFTKQDVEAIEGLIGQYISEYPDDYERFSILCNYASMHEDWEIAKDNAQKAILLNPYNLEADYNMAYISEYCGDLATAHLYYSKLMSQQRVREKELMSIDELSAKVNEIEQKAKDLFNQGDKTLYAAVLHNNRYIRCSIKDPFRFNTDIAGQVFFDERDCGYYTCAYGDLFNSYWNVNPPKGSATTKLEIMPISQVTNQTLIDVKGEYILPIVTIPDYKGETTMLGIEQDGETIYIPVNNKQSYYYVRLHGPAAVASDHEMIFGQPIPVGHKEGNKKLVLNIFIDSFNWRVFEEASRDKDALEGMKNIMPNTYRFFQKGTICTNAYVDAEWTTPSMSTYWTGVHSTTHMNLDNDIWYPYDQRFKLLAEHFHDQGYVTATIDSNDAYTPGKGYMRGMDRALYKEFGYTKDQVVIDALEHMRTFKDCDQFLLMQIEDLHDIAGVFMRTPSVQVDISPQNFAQDNDMKTTVKQGRSLHKQNIYFSELKNIDFYLGLVYDYIERNYEDDEYVVSFFSDHGTAFMVDNDQPVINPQRMHVPMMFRSKQYKDLMSEYVQSTDLGRILCQLAGVPYEQNYSDAHLPQYFGGEDAREYVYSQTIFRGDPYQAMIRDKEGTFYYRTKEPVDSEFGITLKDAESWMEGDNGQRIDNPEKIMRYTNIVMNKISHLIRWE